MEAEDEYGNHWDSRYGRPRSTSRQISPPTTKATRTAETNCRNGKNRKSETYRTWLSDFIKEASLREGFTTDYTD